MKEPLYTIVIPAFNEEGFLAQTLQALQKAMKAQKHLGEIIVVDNNSTDATAKIAKQHGTKVIFEAKNQIATARNTGGKAANGQYLIFLDADTCITDDILNKALNLLQTGAAGGGITVQFDAKLPKSYDILLSIWNAFSKKFKIAAGCFIFCEKQAFDNFGGFNEKLYASEELYFCIALKKWAKAQHKEVYIIQDTSIISSARKFHWHKPFEMWKLIFLIFLLPFFVFSKRLTRKWWYERPLSKK
jgi:glycosyltransferase involved in cell wall biosynthesis